MSRPVKQTVDYFPHRCKPGKTLFILETRYGDKGYAFWFKILELLGTTEGHAYQFSNDQDRQYLQAYTKTDDNQALEILNLLADLEAIDKPLWQSNQIIWSDNFIEGIKDAYRNRTVTIPVKPVSYVRNSTDNGIPDVRNPQRREEKKRVDKRRIKDSKPFTEQIKDISQEWWDEFNQEYKDLDIPKEIVKCTEYYERQDVKSIKLTLRNWMDHARSFKSNSFTPTKKTGPKYEAVN